MSLRNSKLTIVLPHYIDPKAELHKYLNEVARKQGFDDPKYKVDPYPDLYAHKPFLGFIRSCNSGYVQVTVTDVVLLLKQGRAGKETKRIVQVWMHR